MLLITQQNMLLAPRRTAGNAPRTWQPVTLKADTLYAGASGVTLIVGTAEPSGLHEMSQADEDALIWLMEKE